MSLPDGPAGGLLKRKRPARRPQPYDRFTKAQLWAMLTEAQRGAESCGVSLAGISGGLHAGGHRVAAVAIRGAAQHLDATRARRLG